MQKVEAAPDRPCKALKAKGVERARGPMKGPNERPYDVEQGLIDLSSLPVGRTAGPARKAQALKEKAEMQNGTGLCLLPGCVYSPVRP